ncbi:MAG: carbohydrate kinase [Phaeodactylibacter sp.]|nr:carbohydrate kinase [Phaeodactylibacter sp.]
MSVVSFGEVLWDMLPSGKKAGGAPMNVAFHLANFGYNTRLISRVGKDELGRELLNFLDNKGIDHKLVQEDTEQPTSTVQVTLDEQGHASYEIVQPVSWDFIAPSEAAIQAVSEAQALVFGSLGARQEGTRSSLLQLLSHSPLNVFDVNLRPPHYTTERLKHLMQLAHLVKMNDEELDIIAEEYTDNQEEAEKMLAVLNAHDLKGLIVTKGSEGAAWMGAGGQYLQEPVFPVEVADTVGSGDAFLAGFLSQHLQGKPLPECLTFAAAAGAVVATHSGGTPQLSQDDIHTFLAR